MRRDGDGPQHERRRMGERLEIGGELHERHEERAAHAGEDGVAEVLEHRTGVAHHPDDEQGDQQGRHDATCGADDSAERLGDRGLQQVAERGEAERQASCGNGRLLEDVR